MNGASSAHTIVSKEKKGSENGVEKDKKNKKEMKNKNSKLEQNCNISKVTDNVEFANEPFNDANKKKSNRDENNKN
ncbi:MAG: hypothetical protein DDT30_00491 [Dehalococcoidia bacterium]|nr:hypothetical protein [Bacillota bacterium]MBT9143051.1 hypothetical protein [Bacillota bacterium]